MGRGGWWDIYPDWCSDRYAFLVDLVSGWLFLGVCGVNCGQYIYTYISVSIWGFGYFSGGKGLGGGLGEWGNFGGEIDTHSTLRLLLLQMIGFPSSCFFELSFVKHHQHLPVVAPKLNSCCVTSECVVFVVAAVGRLGFACLLVCCLVQWIVRACPSVLLLLLLLLLLCLLSCQKHNCLAILCCLRLLFLVDCWGGFWWV